MPTAEQEEIRKLKKRLKKQERKNAEIRDQMAIQRTIFANERTLMAYLRTAIALIAGGFAAIKLSHHAYMEVIGLVLMPLGVAVAVYSFARYLRKQKLIRDQWASYTHTSQHHDELHERKAARQQNEDQGAAAGI